MQISFNKASVAALPVGTHYDTKCKGLVCRVTATSRNFAIYVWASGKPNKAKIGNAEYMSVEAARTKAQALIYALKTSPEPKKKTTTLAMLAESYTAYLQSTGKRGQDHMTNMMRLNWQHIENIDIEQITVAQLQDHYFTICNTRGKAAGRTAIITLRVLYNDAARRELTVRNPARAVKMQPATARAVWLEEHEIPAFYKAVATLPTVAAQYLTLLLLTGLRKTNLAKMQWSWIVGNTVVIPASESKNKKELHIPLCAAALAILERRVGVHPIYVWPVGRAGASAIATRVWQLMLREELAKLGVTKSVTLHDLRRTYGAQLTARGAPLQVVAAALGHSNVSSTPIYARTEVSTVLQYLA